VVEETLAGRRRRIKAFSIAQDVFGRDADFDQQRDPVVRVEASRLRKCLGQYYESCDSEPAVRIDIPKGGYAPSFTWPETPVGANRQLSRRWLLLFGMAHASMMEFDQEQVGIRVLKDQYGVTHVLRGSIETRENELRIRSQLIYTNSSETVWSASLQGELSNIWLLQDELTARLLSSLPIELETIDKVQLLSRYTESTEALALYRQGLYMILPPSESKRVQAARQLFGRVIEIDPEFAGGYAGAAWSYALPVVFNATETPDKHLTMSRSYAGQAIEIDPRFGAGHVVLGFAQVLSGDKVEALETARLAAAHAQLGHNQEASAIIRALNKTLPDYPYEPWLARWIGQGEHLQSTLTKLANNGLVFRGE